MARKSEIRASALAALQSLTAAGNATTDREADGLLADALAKLTEAAGLAEPGQGAARLRETGGSANGLLARLQRPEDVTLRERDYSTAERVGLAKRGHAIPVKNDRGEIIDGRYPIGLARDDVENAVHDAVRAGAGRKVRKHIIREAWRLGAADLIPDSWKGGKARESAPLTLREAVAVGELSIVDAASPEIREDSRLSLVQRMGIDRDLF